MNGIMNDKGHNQGIMNNKMLQFSITNDIMDDIMNDKMVTIL